jgi:hypothetical protein
MTGCVCEGPGFCQRHGIRKGDGWHQLCQTSEEYFQSWEAGRGPGQRKSSTPGVVRQRKPGVGDVVEAWLTEHGITAERYVEVKRLFGLPPTCGCTRRREWLNKVGQWLNGE